MMVWEQLHPEMTFARLGFIPMYVDDTDPRSAREQFNDHYSFAGGWRPFKGHTLDADNRLHYPEDPPLIPLAQTRLRDELIVFYDHAWIAVIQPDRTFEVCRMD
jgi:hypothetical protein